MQRVRGLYGLLSAVTLGLETGDCLVLNSVANVEKGDETSGRYERIDCYLDRDEPDGARWKRWDTLEKGDRPFRHLSRRLQGLERVSATDNQKTKEQ